MDRSGKSESDGRESKDNQTDDHGYDGTPEQRSLNPQIPSSTFHACHKSSGVLFLKVVPFVSFQPRPRVVGAVSSLPVW